MVDWRNADVLKFLECYKAEACIWDPNNKYYRNKQKRSEAWIHISKTLKKSVKELKYKKHLFLFLFRKYLRRKHECAEYNEVYKPPWFAYELMESFLLPTYTARLGLTPITQLNHEELKGTRTDDSLADLASSGKSDLGEQDMDTAYAQTMKVLADRRNGDEDECDIYAKFLTKQMRELSTDERRIMMFKIDGLFIKYNIESSHIPCQKVIKKL